MGSFRADVELYLLVVLSMCLMAFVMWHVMRFMEKRAATHAKNIHYPLPAGKPVFRVPAAPTTQVNGVAPSPVIMTGTMPVIADMNYQIVNVRFPTNP